MRLMSKRTVAKRLEVSPKTIDRWVKMGRFPRPIILPSSGDEERISARWKELDVDVWIELQKSATESEK